jgi:hypothetical protein
MKVFKFDVSRSAKGDFIEDIARPHSTGGYVQGSEATPPRHNKATHSWRVIGDAGYNDSRPNLSYPFPVCFCMGQFSCGTEAPIWEWVILLPTKPTPAPMDCDDDGVSDAEWFGDYNRECNPDSL